MNTADVIVTRLRGTVSGLMATATWLAVGSWAIVVLSILLNVTLLPLVVGQCALPVVTVLGLAGAAVATVRRRFPAILVAVATIVGCGAIVLPTVTADPVPAWASSSDHLAVYSSNLYWANDRIDEALAVAVASEADVVVLFEFMPVFDGPLRRSGLLDAYPNVVRSRSNGDGASNVLLSRLPMVSRRVAGDGSDRLPVMTIRAGSAVVTVVGVHTHGPHDLSDPGGWQRDVAGVGRAAGNDPTVIAIGDFNCTLWNPPLRRLLDGGFTDAHAATGAGLARTWGPRMWPVDATPVLGIDHALSRGGVVPLDVDELVVPGSDHRALLVDYAVR